VTVILVAAGIVIVLGLLAFISAAGPPEDGPKRKWRTP